MAFLEIDDVHKTSATTTVLKGINLDVEEHQVVCLIGASGCGKSRCCAASTRWRRSTRARSASTATGSAARASTSTRCAATSASCSRASTCSRT